MWCISICTTQKSCTLYFGWDYLTENLKEKYSINAGAVLDQEHSLLKKTFSPTPLLPKSNFLCVSLWVLLSWGNNANVYGVFYVNYINIDLLSPLVITLGVKKFKNHTFISPTCLNGILKVDTEIIMPVQSAWVSSKCLKFIKGKLTVIESWAQVGM